MNLSPPVARIPKHTRRIVCEGYRREDGLWDIDARIVDTKAFRYTEPERGPRAIGDPVHDMAVRLTLDDEMVVRDIEVVFNSTPYPECQGAGPNFRELVGARIGPGWRKAVQACVGGTRGCTHVRELLFPMATVAYQTMSGWSSDGEDPRPAPPREQAGKPYFLDGCHAWSASGPVVARFHPHLYRRDAGNGDER